MISDFGYILLYVITALAFCVLTIGIAKFLRPHRPSYEKLTTYESGEEPTGNANVRFNIRFYVISLLFVLFDIELIFLFPWATVFADKQLNEDTNGLWSWYALAEMFVFIGILVLGLAYAWVKGHLDWVKPDLNTPDFKGPVPSKMYEEFNQKY
ncbi:MAG: NADH-quinone oxidoreductase subunit A [Pseudarcicella sp.]|nr:NADH-quinone oxidoreductase subunit A [Pseudarcicella sp.]